MFKELYPLVQSAPIVMQISLEGEDLRINVTQKADKKGKPLALSITGSPEELDAELPGSIAEASGQNGHKAVADQVREQFSGVKAPAAKATPAPGSAAAPEQPDPESRAGRKQACIDDYVRLASDRKTKDKLNREFFIEKAGRNFERLFDNWTKFKAAAERFMTKAARAPAAPAQETLPASSSEEPPVVDDKTLPLPGVEDPAQAAEAHAERTGETSAAAAPQQPNPWRVELADGTLLFEGNDTGPLESGGTVTFGADVYLIVEIVKDQRLVVVAPKAYIVKRGNNGAVLGTEKRALDVGAEIELVGDTWIIELIVDDQDYIVRPKFWRVVLSSGEEICREEREHLAPTARIDHAGTSYRVVDVVPGNYRYVVAPVVLRNVIDQDGEKVGISDEDSAAGEPLDLDGTVYKVVRVAEKALFVERAAATEGA